MADNLDSHALPNAEIADGMESRDSSLAHLRNSNTYSKIERYTHTDDIEMMFLPTAGFNSVEFERKLNAMIESKVTEKFSSLLQKSTNLEEHSECEPESNPLVWNINAMSLLCWKGWDWPHNQRWNNERKKFERSAQIKGSEGKSGFQYLTETYILRYFLCYFPIVLAFFEVNTLAGMTDQGSTLKRMIYGDGYYQSALWRFSRTAASRDTFKSIVSSNGTKLGLTANILRNRPASEASRCMDSEFLTATNRFVWTNDSAVLESVFWPLVDKLKPNTSWLFSHCLPWEYANLCANVLRANALHEMEISGTSSSSWYPSQCILPDPNAHPLMSVKLWEGLSASPEEIRQSFSEAKVPLRLEEQADLALWVVTRQVCDAKTLNFNDDSFSAFLYINVNYLYRLGVGEAYIVELMTITTLSFFLFYTSFLAEAQQLMHQVTLSSTLRCYEDIVIPMGDLKASAPSSHALLRKAGKKLACGWFWTFIHYIALVNSDLMCDLFLSLRIIFLAYMVMCTEMITTWDHGVLAVIFSVLAIAFLFEIDDKLMEVFETMGWKDSAFYRAKLEPMLSDFALEERRERMSYDQDKLAKSSLSKHIFLWWSRGLRQPTVWGLTVVRFWAFLLVTAFFIVHQYLVFEIATSTGTQEDIVRVYDSIFYEWGSEEFGGGYQIAKLSGGIFAFCFVNTVCYRGISALGNLIQLGLCLIWTYAVFREVVINGVLVWFADLRSDQSVQDHVVNYLFHDRAILFFPPFSLHILGCLLRPFFFYLRSSMTQSRNVQNVTMAEYQGLDAPIHISCTMVIGNTPTETEFSKDFLQF